VGTGVRTKSVGTVSVMGRHGPPVQRPSSAADDPHTRPLRLKLTGDAAEAILPHGGTTDEFTTRLGAWLAGVAMNDQGAA
jgi:hypothetical protein